ncbi:MAG: tetratricopeptide repeat protein [Ignavibacteria bacterium]|nr:tetratricopeptide repeat protein [Ignavibacteria bacterium]
MRTLIPVILLLSLSGAALAQDPEQVFESANALYQEGRYEEARDQYESIVANGDESAALYLNLGNTYVRLGHMGKAILSYERGLRLRPDDEDLLYNLGLTGLMTVDKIETVPRLFLWDIWDGMKGWFSPAGILWTAWGAYVFVFMALAAIVLAGSFTLRRTAFLSAIGGTVVFLLLLLIGIGRYSDLTRTDFAIIMTEIVAVKNSPDARDTDAFILHRGTKVQITDNIGEWVKVRLADGKVGWLVAESVEAI